MGARVVSVIVSCNLVCALVAGCGGATQGGSAGPVRLTAPMGWNSWNSGIPLSEQTVEQTIDAMVSSGMRDAGYRYVNLDAGWAAPTRGADGKLRTDPTEFPDGIAAVSSYAHDRGMLVGIYASPFDETCGQDLRIASKGQETVDAQTFADWRVDYLKYDWCRSDADHADQVQVFTAMRNALRATGRRIFYSINPNSSDDHLAGVKYDWSGIADMARTTADLVPVWRNTLPPIDSSDAFLTGTYLGVPDAFAASSTVAGKYHPGYSNDPDMLVVGLSRREFFVNHLAVNRAIIAEYQVTPDRLTKLREKLVLSDPQLDWRATAQPSLTESEQRVHFSLWSMLAAPLIAGNDVRDMTDSTRNILTNTDVIDVDQDSLVARAVPSAQDPRVLVKPLADGDVAVALVNTDEQAASIEVDATAVGLPRTPCYTVRDLWSHTDTTGAGQVSRTVAPHDVAMLRISPRCRQP
ncbi:glycoside hydrolase family 27 protein [Mycolicibacterium moriokaense]|nr:glycoside hydrolase family 27 protein [Mycolicibacterium moriokaense]